MKEDDIPPPVATGQAAKPPLAAPIQSDRVGSSSPQKEIEDITPKPTPPSRSAPAAVPTPLVKIKTPSPEPETQTADSATVQLLESRQHEYRDAALAAKRAGNKEEALKYFKVLKVSVIALIPHIDFPA